MATVLPDHILKLMSPKDRKILGQKTWEECVVNGQFEYEKKLQKDALNLLQSKGIEVFYQRMDKKTRGRKGQPDHLFAVDGQAYAWEYKSPRGKCTLDQERVIDRMMSFPNKWNCKVIRSLQEVIKALAEMKI